VLDFFPRTTKFNLYAKMGAVERQTRKQRAAGLRSSFYVHAAILKESLVSLIAEVGEELGEKRTSTKESEVIATRLPLQ